MIFLKQFKILKLFFILSALIIISISLQSCDSNQSIKAIRVSTSQISLEWDDEYDKEMGYKIYRRDSRSRRFKEIAIVPADSTSFNDTGLTVDTTYFYKIRAYFKKYNSVYSNIAIATTAQIEPKPPGKFKARVVCPHKVFLTWTDRSSNEQGFIIERKYKYGTYKEVTKIDADKKQYRDKNLSANTTYFYRIKTYNEIGFSEYIQELEIKTRRNYIIPDDPKNLEVTVMSDKQIDLSWDDNSSNELGFKIIRRSEDGEYAEIVSVGEDRESFSDTDLNYNTRYYYQVIAYNNEGNSDYSNEVSATTNNIAPYPPVELKATADYVTINLTWTDNSDNEYGFKIERSLDGVNFREIDTVDKETVSYEDTGLEPEITYYYRIKAYNEIGNSEYTNISSDTTFDFRPEPPSDLSAVPVSSDRIDLTWQENSHNELGFKIFRSENGTDFEQKALVSAASRSYNDTGLDSGTRYYYRITAYNNTGDSLYSNVSDATTSNLDGYITCWLAVKTNSLIQLNWNDGFSNEQGFKIERSLDGNQFTQIAIVNKNMTQYNNTGLEQGTRYYYRVRAYNNTGHSNYSSVRYGVTYFLGSGTIGYTGGTIFSHDGNAILIIPYNALDDEITLSFEEIDPAILPNAGNFSFIGKAYNLKPDGTAFKSNVTLKIHFNTEELASKGLAENTSAYYLNNTTNSWDKIFSFISTYNGTMTAHLAYFSTYAIRALATCSDQIQNYNETGIDCGGNCPAACVNCDCTNNPNFGNAASSWVYSFNDTAVKNAAQESLQKYAAYYHVDVSTLNTPEKKMSAVGWYVTAYMKYMYDEGSWSGTQSAATTVRKTVNRRGCFYKDGDGNCRDYGRCGDKDSPYVNGEKVKYCGDCEDFSVLRGSLLRHLGVSHNCIIMADHHAGWPHPQDDPESAPWNIDISSLIIDAEGPGTPPQAYNDVQRISSNSDEIQNELLLDQSDGKTNGGHTFNVVLYYNKYRLMDYFHLGYFFSSNSYWESHEIDNVWTDHYGRHWNNNLNPATKIHNYPGNNKCYESGRNYWTLDTLYTNICP